MFSGICRQADTTPGSGQSLASTGTLFCSVLFVHVSEPVLSTQRVLNRQLLDERRGLLDFWQCSGKPRPLS